MAEQKKKPGRPKGSKNKKPSVNNDKQSEIKKMQEERKADKKVIDEIWAVTIFALGIFLIFTTQLDTTGEFGNAINNVLSGIFGGMSIILPYYIMAFAILLFFQKTNHVNARTVIFAILIYILFCIFNSQRFIDVNNLAFGFEEISKFYSDGIAHENAGVIGMFLGEILIKTIGSAGLNIFCVTGIVVSILLVINTPISKQIERFKNKREEKNLLKAYEKNSSGIKDDISPERVKHNSSSDVPIIKRSNNNYVNIMKYMSDDEMFDRNKLTGETGLEEKKSTKEGFGIDEETETVIKKTTRKSKEEIPPEDIKIVKSETNDEYKLPSLSLLKKPSNDVKGLSDYELMSKAKQLEKTLKSFNVDAKVIQVIQGSSVTRYEIQPNIGVKVNSIVRLADDIALNLKAKSIRIEAPIPGKAAVGIEVENEKTSPVLLKEIIDSSEFKNSKSKITFAVGKDIAGKNVVADLKEMPHMLIAGATGSGKSVCINSIILSLLYKAKPDEVKFILVDPKVVELGVYNGIPHLLIPVVTDPKKAAAALNWAVNEMNDRYIKFADAGVRDLESFNELAQANDENEKFMPQIVIIIDELADLMMAAPSQVEEAICRLAQMARAAGMHLIVATQRPSVDVVTGVIKANIPSRIAFSVSSQFDSRTIIDMGGAEKLLGKGDMLFSPVGKNKPLRTQGPFVSDEEVADVIKYVKKQGEPNYSENIITSLAKTDKEKQGEMVDELTEDAIECILKSKQASVSMLQRRFRIGYNRAARIIDEIEERGIIGPSDGSRPRQLLISEDEYYQAIEIAERIEEDNE
ncbi:MAG: DNA translocase FtsK 4TM domain-containing protein [Peptostreptococcaceae bacterium]|nr:DNA translocase FtsK 4TM domain-containing protein [Peptostreptococcaceae bacterium]